MRTLAILFLLSLTACMPGSDYHTTQESELSFHAGQLLRIRTGFYANCLMRLTGYRNITTNGNRPTYFGVIDCPGVDNFEGNQNELNLELVK